MGPKSRRFAFEVVEGSALDSVEGAMLFLGQSLCAIAIRVLNGTKVIYLNQWIDLKWLIHQAIYMV